MTRCWPPVRETIVGGAMQGRAPVAPVRCRTEADLEWQVADWAIPRGIVHFHINVKSQRGWPDHLYIFNGRCCFIEFKSEGERPKGIQSHYLRVLNANGTPAIWTDSYADAIHFLVESLSLDV